MVPGSRLRQIGWFVVLTICLACFMALTFRVNTVKSEVRLAERRIVQLESEKLLLETEFETRANQQQLANWNAIEFGYKAPRADQYVEGERQLASLGLPKAFGSPSPIRVARAPDSAPVEVLENMVSPVTGRKLTTEVEHDTSSDAKTNRIASDFARAFGETTPIVARVAEAVE